MDIKLTFEQFNQNLDDGYQIYFTYVRLKQAKTVIHKNFYQKILKIRKQDMQ